MLKILGLIRTTQIQKGAKQGCNNVTRSEECHAISKKLKNKQISIDNAYNTIVHRSTHFLFSFATMKNNAHT